jgi:hypothetical protein
VKESTICNVYITYKISLSGGEHIQTLGLSCLGNLSKCIPCQSTKLLPLHPCTMQEQSLSPLLQSLHVSFWIAGRGAVIRDGRGGICVLELGFEVVLLDNTSRGAIHFSPFQTFQRETPIRHIVQTAKRSARCTCSMKLESP